MWWLLEARFPTGDILYAMSSLWFFCLQTNRTVFPCFLHFWQVDCNLRQGFRKWILNEVCFPLNTSQMLRRVNQSLHSCTTKSTGASNRSFILTDLFWIGDEHWSNQLKIWLVVDASALKFMERVNTTVTTEATKSVLILYSYKSLRSTYKLYIISSDAKRKTSIFITPNWVGHWLFDYGSKLMAFTHPTAEI